MTIDEDCLQPDDMPRVKVGKVKLDYADACVLRYALIRLSCVLLEDPSYILGPIGEAYRERTERLCKLFHA